MASIMPFPNVATHRRMPHLPNQPKPTTTTLPQQPTSNQGQSEAQQQQIDYTLLNQQAQDTASSHLRLTAGHSSSPLRLLEDNQGRLPTASSSSPLSLSAAGNPTRTIQDRPAAGEDHTHMHARPLSPSPSGLNPSSFPTSPAMTSHDSKMIKTALYDAFGCLYHPSAHTKHSLTSNAVALRSGDVTPLMGLSPKASPLLRPNLGPSAPITPLELSEDGTAAGYFALTSSSPASPALNGAGSVPSRNHGHGHHHPHRQTHGSSHLSSTFTSESHEGSGIGYGHGHRSPLSLSRRESVVDMVLNPEEHPVLSSLQTLSITHPHPLEHYHPHLGHELGHDRIPIEEPFATASSIGSAKPSTPQPSGGGGGGGGEATATQVPGQQTPLVHASIHNNKLGRPPSSGLFPMDHGDHDSIPGFGQQGLV